MSKVYAVEIEINEEMLRNACEDSVSTLDYLIYKEFHWLADSGIQLISVVSKEDLIEKDEGIMYYKEG